MTAPQTGFQGQPNPGFQQQQGQNGPTGHIPMPPGMGAFDGQLAGMQQRGGQGFPVSSLPPVQGSQQQPAMGQPQLTQQQLQAQQQQQQQGAQTWNPYGAQQTPQQQQLQQGQQQQQQPQQQQQAVQPINQNQVVMTEQTVLDGPSIPAELRGRTWGEALAIYNGMRGMVLNRQLPQVQPPVQQQPAQQQQQVQQPQQQQAQPQNSDFFRDPVGVIRRVVGEMQQQGQQQLMQQFQPVLQQSYQQGIQQIRAQIANEVGVQRYAQIEPRVLQLIQGADAQSLMNPQFWRVAVHTAVGELAMNQQAGPQFQGRQQPIQQGSTPAGQFPIQQQSGNPLPNLGSFFTEAPGSGGGNVGGMQLTPEQKQAAALMQMSEADYAAWMGGVPQGGRR